MPDATVYDTSDPAVRARLVGWITDEQAEIDYWRAVLDDGPQTELALTGIDAAQAVMARFMALLAEGVR